jgi:Transposase
MPEGIAAAIRLSLTSARAEALNTKVRLIVRHAYGFHAADAVLALVMLAGGPPTCAYRSKGGEVTHIEVGEQSLAAHIRLNANDAN